MLDRGNVAWEGLGMDNSNIASAPTAAAPHACNRWCDVRSCKVKMLAMQEKIFGAPQCPHCADYGTMGHDASTPCGSV